MKNFYKILGVEKSATDDEIKKAFRKLSLEHHPDRSTGDEKKFKEVSEAYNILSDTKKRAEYDGTAQGYSAGFDPFSNMNNVFHEMFGGPRHSFRQKKVVPDIKTSVQLSLKEFYVGTTKTISFLRQTTCVSCDGHGYEVSKCLSCHGSGFMTQQQGNISFRTSCRTCNGSGSSWDSSKKCRPCGGAGGTEKMSQEVISFPPGSGHLHEKRMMHLHGKGNIHPHHGTGSVQIFITIEPSSVYSQQGLDLIYNQPVSFSELCLGAKVDVVLPDETSLSVSIPPGTKPNQLLRVKDRGIQQPSYLQVGDLLLDLNLSIPEKLTKEQKSLLEKMKATGI